MIDRQAKTVTLRTKISKEGDCSFVQDEPLTISLALSPRT
jgi:hypothetical protein